MNVAGENASDNFYSRMYQIIIRKKTLSIAYFRIPEKLFCFEVV